MLGLSAISAGLDQGREDEEERLRKMEREDSVESRAGERHGLSMDRGRQQIEHADSAEGRATTAEERAGQAHTSQQAQDKQNLSQGKTAEQRRIAAEGQKEQEREEWKFNEENRRAASDAGAKKAKADAKAAELSVKANKLLLEQRQRESDMQATMQDSQLKLKKAKNEQERKKINYEMRRDMEKGEDDSYRHIYRMYKLKGGEAGAQAFNDYKGNGISNAATIIVDTDPASGRKVYRLVDEEGVTVTDQESGQPLVWDREFADNWYGVKVEGDVAYNEKGELVYLDRSTMKMTPIMGPDGKPARDGTRYEVPGVGTVKTLEMVKRYADYLKEAEVNGLDPMEMGPYIAMITGADKKQDIPTEAHKAALRTKEGKANRAAFVRRFGEAAAVEAEQKAPPAESPVTRKPEKAPEKKAVPEKKEKPKKSVAPEKLVKDLKRIEDRLSKAKILTGSTKIRKGYMSKPEAKKIKAELESMLEQEMPTEIYVRVQSALEKFNSTGVGPLSRKIMRGASRLGGQGGRSSGKVVEGLAR